MASAPPPYSLFPAVEKLAWGKGTGQREGRGACPGGAGLCTGSFGLLEAPGRQWSGLPKCCMGPVKVTRVWVRLPGGPLLFSGVGLTAGLKAPFLEGEES